MAKSYKAGNLEFVVQNINEKTFSQLDLLVAKLQTVKQSLSSVSSLSGRVGTATRSKKTGSSNSASSDIKQTNKQLNITSVSLGKIFNKIYFIRNYTKQTMSSLRNILEDAIDYTETLNLWQVAMRGNTAEAENFVKTMSKAYGIATQTLMQYQAIFKNMLGSLGGIGGETSYALSEYLTQMALDYASLYNVSVERAMTTFQSVLSGQVRPIRSIAGYDISETTIYQLYQQLGGEKTMRQLSQTEKRLLRIYAVFQQMESSGAVGDLGKTMGSTANQMRMFTEQTKEFGTWIGLVIESWLRPFIPMLNAVMITLTNIVKAYAELNNIKPQEFGAVESIEELNEQLDEAQGKLLSFDKFESLSSEEDSSLGVDSQLLSAITEYESVLSRATNKAQELAEQLTKKFVEYDSEGNVVGFTEKVEDLIDVLKLLGVTIGAIAVSKGISSLGKSLLSFGGFIDGIPQKKKDLKDLFDLFNSANKGWDLGLRAETLGASDAVNSLIPSIQGLSKVFSFLTSPVGLVIGAFVLLYATSEDFRNSVNELFNSLKPLLEILLDLVVDILDPIVDIVSLLLDLIGGSAGTGLIKQIKFSLQSAMLVLTPIVASLEYLSKLLKTIFLVLESLINMDFSNFKNNFKGIWSDWSNTTSFAKTSWEGTKNSYNDMKGNMTVEDFAPQTISPSIGLNPNNLGSLISGSLQAGLRGVSLKGDVVMNERVVGRMVAQSSGAEMQRTGTFKFVG